MLALAAGLFLLHISPYLSSTTEIPCTWEESSNVTLQQRLNTTWKVAQKAAGRIAKKARPKVCERVGVVTVTFDDGGVGLLCGYYEPANNTILLVDDRDLCPELRCVLIHEYLHAIVGPGHKGHAAMMKKVGCDEGESPR